MPRIGRFWSDLTEERCIDRDVFDCPGGCLDPEVVPLEKIAQTVPIDKVDGRRTIAGGFLFSVRGEVAGGDQQTFVAPACHCAAKVADCSGAYASVVTLALEEDRETDQAKPVDAET